MPDKLGRHLFVFSRRRVKELELESAFGFSAALLISLAMLKYLALSNVNLDADEEINLTFSCVVALEGLYLGGVSPGVIKTLTKLSQISQMSRPHYRGWR